MFILQDINNYETTGSDKFCEFDREINQNITPSCFHSYKENIWLKNMQLIETKRCFILFRNIVSEFYLIVLSLPLLTDL